MYDQSCSPVHIAGNKSGLFPAHVELWQGYALSSVLAIIFMDKKSRYQCSPLADASIAVPVVEPQTKQTQKHLFCKAYLKIFSPNLPN